MGGWSPNRVPLEYSKQRGGATVNAKNSSSKVDCLPRRRKGLNKVRIPRQGKPVARLVLPASVMPRRWGGWEGRLGMSDQAEAEPVEDGAVRSPRIDPSP